MKKRRTKRNPIPAALAVLKAAEAAAYRGMRRNPIRGQRPRPGNRAIQRVKIAGRIQRSRFTATRKTRIAGDPRKHKRVMRKAGFRVNPSTKHIHLQEKRGTAWVTLALFPLSQKSVAVKIAKQWHRKHPGKTLRLFS